MASTAVFLASEVSAGFTRERPRATGDRRESPFRGTGDL